LKLRVCHDLSLDNNDEDMLALALALGLESAITCQAPVTRAVNVHQALAQDQMNGCKHCLGRKKQCGSLLQTPISNVFSTFLFSGWWILFRKLRAF